MITHKICQFLCLSSQNKKVIFASLGIIFLFCLRQGVILTPDSGTYISLSPVRIGLYPLTILLFQSIFKGYALQALVVFQLGFAIATSYHVATFLRSTFNLPAFMHWVFIATFLSPLIVFKSANEIMSEGLAYPLFLVSSYFLLKGVVSKNIKYLLVFSFSIFLLSFTRQQYLFFYVVGLITLLYFCFFEKGFNKKIKFFLAIIFSCCLLFVSEKTYHYIYHSSFSGTPFTGIQLLIRPLYVSAMDSYKTFEEPKQREFVKEVMQEIFNRNLMDQDPHKRELTGFTLHYNTICHQISSPLLGKIWQPQVNESTMNHLQTINQQTIDISLKLIKINLLHYIKSYTKDVIHGFGGYILWGFVLFTSLLCFIAIFSNRYLSIFYPLFIITTLMHLGNLLIICFFEPPLFRYTYSTGLLLASMLLIMSYQYVNKLSHSSA